MASAMRPARAHNVNTSRIMSTKYKFGEKTGANLVSFATVNWIDWKYSSAKNYGNNDQTILEIDLN
jgi:hypothetical protein